MWKSRQEMPFRMRDFPFFGCSISCEPLSGDRCGWVGCAKQRFVFDANRVCNFSIHYEMMKRDDGGASSKPRR